MLHEAQIVEAFRRAMADKGIVTDDDLVADGEFHRMHVEGDKRKVRNGWYVLHLAGRKPAGAFGCNKRFGNNAKFTWAGDESKPLTLEERREYRRLSERKRLEKEAVERKRRAEAQAQAQAIWDAASDCEGQGHVYLKRKGVRSHGLRVGPWTKINEETGEVWTVTPAALLVPIRDAKKTIHSMQAIYPKKVGGRDKDFLKHGPKEGLFYSFGKPQTVDVGGQQRMVIMIGEGYATLASAHECTGHAAIVAFDAGNLLPVAKVIRARFPDACLVFLADNDQWTGPTPKNPHTPENPGLTKAREAAKAVGGLVAVPPFAHSLGVADSEGKVSGPTDFNDLFQLQGADAVRQVIDDTLNPPVLAAPEPVEVPPWEDAPADVEAAPQAPALVAPLAAPLPPPVSGADDVGPIKNPHFTVLGYNRGTYYFFLHGQGQIKEMSASGMSELGLIEIAGLNWWEDAFPGERSKIDTKAAAEFLIRTAEKRGIYDPSRSRGRGAWVDDGRMVYHHGGYLSVDGKATDITRIKSRYVYELEMSLPDPSETAMTSDEGEALLDLAAGFRWSKPGSAALLAGWVALAPMCGALRWRPHIWITGGAGCGKSTVLNDFVHHLLDGLSEFAQGNSSEAGIRQTLGSHALPVLFDESESNEEADARRIQNVLSLIRQASTETKAKTMKGTAGGSSMSFLTRSMFCLASIQVALKQQADVERLSVLSLRSKHEDKDPAKTWQRISQAINAMKADLTLPARLFRRSIDLLPTTLRNVGVFSAAAAQVFGSQRDGDQYGTLLAGAWSLISTELVTHDQAMEMINRYDWSEHHERHGTDESVRALQSLMEAHVRVKSGIELTVFELVKAAYGVSTEHVDVNQQTADAILQRYGMKLDGDRLLLSNDSNELRRLMKDTTFAADYRGVLLRVPGADRHGNKATRFSGVPSKCISLPLAPIVNDSEAVAF